MSTLKVGTIQDHANSNTAISIDSSGRVTLPQRVAFQAKKSDTSTLSANSSSNITFNTTDLAHASWNGTTFTAPVAGKYFFSYTFQYKCTSGYLQVELRKGVSGSYSSYGRMLVYPPQQSSLYSGPGIIGIMDLAAGNTVKPVAQVNYAGNQIQNVNFSGYLLG